MSEVHDVTIPPDLAGQRLDKALAELLPDLSRARLQALLAKGRVSAGGTVVTEGKRKVKGGETFAVDVPDAVPPAPRAQAMDLAVVYEDGQLIVIDKPKGLVVHPAAGNAEGTLVNALIAHCGASLSGIGGVARPGIVHRLDKDTSGLLVAAKTDLAHRGLSAQFQDHSIDRAYRAVVWGVPRPREGVIEGNIGRDPRNRKKMAVRPGGGKPAKTFYKVLEPFRDLAALVECRLATGRTHQIRVHMSHLGNPVVGDPLYGGRRNRGHSLPSGQKAHLPGFNTQALHACILGFTHPSTGDRKIFESNNSYYINQLCDFFRSV